MERGLDVPEQSQGDAAEGTQPGPVDSGATEAPVETAAPEQAEGAAPDTVAAAEAEAAAVADTSAVQTDAAEVEAAAAAEPTVPVAAERAAEGPVEASAPAGPAVPAAREEEEPVPVSGPPRKRTLTGNVVSDKGNRTIVVSIARRKKHSLYKKYITLTKKLKAHDPDNECQVGDLVRVVESRPLSKEKRWRLVEIVKRAG